MKISEILHIAADRHLVSCEDQKPREFYGTYQAINQALEFNVPLDDVFRQRQIIMDGLIEMGLHHDGFAGVGIHFQSQEQHQSARYIWLKWAALMAEEQGV